MMTMANRPTLTPELTETEFLRWYWLRSELADIARALAIPSSGAKVALTARIAAALGGRPIQKISARRAPTAPMTGPLTRHTVIPEGERCSQVLRAWFVQQLGSSFRFDQAMRDFFASTDGTQTLSDALTHWTSTRTSELRGIDVQFEYNRFTRAWHGDHPNGSSTELREAWSEYRDLPIDARTRA